MKHALIIFLFTLGLQQVVVGQNGTDEQQSMNFVERMDSMMLEFNYQKHYPTKADTQAMNKYGYRPYEIPRFTEAEYQKRLKEMGAIVPMDYNRYVQLFIDVYAMRKRNLTSQLIGLQHIYFPIIEEIFEREGVPQELKYVAAIESAFNPHAQSYAQAVGLWQFVYGTGRMYKLRIDNYVDERRDPYKSTLAAARYFKDLYKIFNDWHLVLAAYNAGPGTVSRAIRRSGGITNFWKLSPYLPRATAGYVPAFIGCAYSMRYATEHNLYPVWADFSYNQDTIHIINQKVTLEQIAAATSTELGVLKRLNPELKLAAIPYSSQAYILRVPQQTAIVAHQLGYKFGDSQPETNPVAASNEPTPAISPTTHYSAAPTYSSPNPSNLPPNTKLVYHSVSRGESLSRIAVYYKVNENQLMAWNGLTGSSNLNIGQTLKVYCSTSINESTAVIRPGQSAPVKVQPPAARTHLVRNGDTLWTISQRYQGVSVEKLMAANGLSKNSVLRVGQVLKLPN